MPSYVSHIVIDWSYPSLSLDEQRVARSHEVRVRADPHSYTADDLEDALAQASRELPGRLVVASYVNEDGAALGFALRDGELVDDDRDPEADGTYTGSFDAADYAAGGVARIYVTLYWPESMLEALSAEAARQDRSWSAITQRILELDQDPNASSWPRYAFARGESKRKQSVYLTTEQLLQLRARAEAADCSMSKLVQQAFERCFAHLVASHGA